MAFKDIVVHVDGSGAVRLGVAARLAEAQQAHLVALHVRSNPPVPQFLLAQYGASLDEVRNRFDQQAAEAAKALVDRLAPAAGTGVEWRDVSGPLLETVALHARYADLTVVGQSRDDSSETPLPDALLFAMGRPLLVVPHAGDFPTLGRRVLVAWNGSREAARAVHDALPVLVGADRVHVMAVNPTGGMAGHGDIPGADICLHLSRHGVNAVCEHIRSDDIGIGEMLLSRAADESVDLLVMGAYGRSRVSEMVLGGATRHILKHMTVPVLMSH